MGGVATNFGEAKINGVLKLKSLSSKPVCANPSRGVALDR